MLTLNGCIPSTALSDINFHYICRVRKYLCTI